LRGLGLDIDGISCRGQADKLIEVLHARRSLDLATPKQLKYLIHFKHPSPESATIKEATDFLGRYFRQKPQTAKTI
ncbi:MAG TPA: hypothetical protein VD994_17015, partial [Prosthecobacter sp.]|nr:hypothetical protein [Prosthecobacter sp.]